MKVNVKDFVKSKGIKTAPLLALGAVMILMGVAIGAFYQMFSADTQFAVRVQGIDGMFVQAGDFSNYDNKVPLTTLAVQKYGVDNTLELALSESIVQPVALLVINDYDLDVMSSNYTLKIDIVDIETSEPPVWNYQMTVEFVQFCIVDGVPTIINGGYSQVIENASGMFYWEDGAIDDMLWENSAESTTLNCLAIAYTIQPSLYSPTYATDDVSVAISMVFGIGDGLPEY